MSIPLVTNISPERRQEIYGWKDGDRSTPNPATGEVREYHESTHTWDVVFTPPNNGPTDAVRYEIRPNGLGVGYHWDIYDEYGRRIDYGNPYTLPGTYLEIFRAKRLWNKKRKRLSFEKGRYSGRI